MTQSDASWKRPLVLGPLPPPIGGIATIIAKLFEDPAAASSISLLDTRRHRDGIAGAWSSLRLLLRLFRRLARRPSRALVFSSAYTSFWEKSVWLALARLCRVPMAVMMVDGNFPEFHRRLPPPLKWLARRVLESYEVVIAQTEGWRRYYQEIAPAARLVVLSNGVDLAEFPARQRDANAVPIVLFVGWLIPAKGVFDLLEAARLLHAESRPFSLQLVGPQHGFAVEIEQLISESGLADVVQVRAEVWSRLELLQIYREADIFALPSWAEGLPNALMEAMACGLPVVATQVGGIPDLVEDGVSGRLIPARQPELLAAALRPLLEDADLRTRFGTNASAKIARSFVNDSFVTGLHRLLSA